MTGQNPESGALFPNGMSRRTLLKGGAAAASGVLLGAVPGARAGVLNGMADTVLRGGAIHTLDPRQPFAQALAISGGRIVYVGDDNGVAGYTGSGTTVVELGGRAVLPGIHDAHMHPLSGGQSLTAPSLDYAQLQLPAFIDAIAKLLAETSEDEPDGWLVVGEWDATVMNKTPNKGHLDDLRTSRPIIVYALDGHIALVNSRALQLAGITDGTPDPQGGEIRRDRSGEATGILLDNAIGLVSEVVPDPTTAQNARALEAAFKVMNEQGITSYLDAAAGDEERAALVHLSDAGKVTLRPSIAPVVEAEDIEDVAGMLDELAAIRAAQSRPDIAIRTVKMFFDGVVEYPTQTAAMIRPYRKKKKGFPCCQPGNDRGPTYFPQEIADRGIAAADAAGWQVHVHAIGDRAIRSALNSFEHARGANGESDHRHTIAHVEIVHPRDIPRFGELGVLPNMQLHWAERDDYTIDKLKPYIGKRRWRYTYPAGSLQRAGATLCGGSDWPVDPLLPFRQIEISINRKADEIYAGYPKPLFAGREGLSRRGSLVMHIRNAAFQLFQEGLTGRLMPGLEADLIVLDRDPLQVKLSKLSKTKVLTTMVAGRVVHGSTELSR